MKKVWFVLAAFVAMLAISLPGAFARTDTGAAPAAVPGISKTSITIGGSFPLSGPVSSVRADRDAAWRPTSSGRTSAGGLTSKLGVYGRKIDFKILDDAYNPANTVQTTNQLVLQDKVFAIVGTLGTEPNLAIRPFLNQRKMPQILVSTGASYFGLQYKQFPWTSRVAARLHRDCARVRAMDRAERTEREDRGLLPERRLRQGLSEGSEDRPRREALAHRLGARLRGHGHELRVTDRTAEGDRRRHLGPADDAGTPTVRAIATGKALELQA